MRGNGDTALPATAAAVRPVDLSAVVLSKTLVQLPCARAATTSTTTATTRATQMDAACDVYAHAPRMLLVPVDRTHMLVSYRAAAAAAPPLSSAQQQQQQPAAQTIAVRCHDTSAPCTCCSRVATLCLHDDSDGDERERTTCTHATAATARTMSVCAGLPFDSFDGWVRDYTLAHMRRQARVLYALWHERAVAQPHDAQSHDTHDDDDDKKDTRIAAADDATTRQGDDDDIGASDDAHDDNDNDSDVVFARRYRERVGHRFLVSDATRHAIWAVHVDGACARRVRVVSPTAFYDEHTSTTAMPAGEQAATMATTTSAPVADAPLLGGVAGFVDGAFAMARFRQPTSLCWRIDDDDDDDDDKTQPPAQQQRPLDVTLPARRRGAACADDRGGATAAVALRRHTEVLFISDAGNHAIRYANFRTRLVRTVAGLDGVPGYRDGACVSCALHTATALAWCAAGLLFADGPNATLRLITGIAHTSSDTTTTTTTNAATDGARDDDDEDDGGAALAQHNNNDNNDTTKSSSVRPRVWTVAGAPPSSSSTIGTRERDVNNDNNTDADCRYVDAERPQRARLGYPADIAVVERATADGGAAAVVFVDTACNAVRVLDACGVRTLVGVHDYCSDDAAHHTDVDDDDNSNDDHKGKKQNDACRRTDKTAVRHASDGAAALPDALRWPSQLLACTLVVERPEEPTAAAAKAQTATTTTTPVDEQQQQRSHAHANLLLSSTMAFVVVSAHTACASLLVPVAHDAQMQLQATTCRSTTQLTSPRLESGDDDDAAAVQPCAATPTTTTARSHVPEATPRRGRSGAVLDTLLRIGRVSEGKRVLCEAGRLSVERVVRPYDNNNDDDNDNDDDDKREATTWRRRALTRYVRLQLPWVLPPRIVHTATCLTRLYCHVSGQRRTRAHRTATTTTTTTTTTADTACGKAATRIDTAAMSTRMTRVAVASRSHSARDTYAAHFDALSPRAQRARAQASHDVAATTTTTTRVRQGSEERHSAPWRPRGDDATRVAAAAALSRVVRARSAAAAPPLTPRALSAHRLMRRVRSASATHVCHVDGVTATTTANTATTATSPRVAQQQPQQVVSLTQRRASDDNNNNNDNNDDKDTSARCVAACHGHTRRAYDEAVCALFAVYAHFARRTSELQPVPALPSSLAGGDDDDDARQRGRHRVTTPRTSTMSLLHVVSHSLSLLSLYRFVYHTAYLACPVAAAYAQLRGDDHEVHTKSSNSSNKINNNSNSSRASASGSVTSASSSSSSSSSTTARWLLAQSTSLLARSTDGVLLPVAPHDARALVEALHRCSQRRHGYHAAAPMHFGDFRRLLLLLTLMERTARDVLLRQQQQQQDDDGSDTRLRACRVSVLHRVPLADTLTEQQRVDAYAAAYTRAVAHVPGLRTHTHMQREDVNATGSKGTRGVACVTAARAVTSSLSPVAPAVAAAHTPPLSPVAPHSHVVTSPAGMVSVMSSSSRSSNEASDGSRAGRRRCQVRGWQDALPPVHTAAATTTTTVDVHDAVDAVLCLLVRNEAALQQLFDAYSEPVHVQPSAHYMPPQGVTAAGTGTTTTTTATATMRATSFAPQDVLWQLRQLYTSDTHSATSRRSDDYTNSQRRLGSSSSSNRSAMTLRVVRYRAFVELCRVTDVYPSLLSAGLLQRAYVDALCTPLFDVTRVAHADDDDDDGSVRCACRAAVHDAARRPSRPAVSTPSARTPPRTPPSCATTPVVAAADAACACVHDHQHDNAPPRRRGGGSSAQRGVVVRDELLVRSGLTFLPFAEAFVRLALTAFTLDADASDASRLLAAATADAFPTAAAKVDALMRFVNQQIRLGRVAERLRTATHNATTTMATSARASFPLRASTLFCTSASSRRSRRESNNDVDDDDADGRTRAHTLRRVA